MGNSVTLQLFVMYCIPLFKQKAMAGAFYVSGSGNFCTGRLPVQFRVRLLRQNSCFELLMSAKHGEQNTRSHRGTNDSSHVRTHGMHEQKIARIVLLANYL